MFNEITGPTRHWLTMAKDYFWFILLVCATVRKHIVPIDRRWLIYYLCCAALLILGTHFEMPCSAVLGSIFAGDLLQWSVPQRDIGYGAQYRGDVVQAIADCRPERAC